MAQFIGFLMNRATKEEFVAPTEAQNRTEAQMVLEQVYPPAFYSTLTIYARSELNHALTSVDRWPGLPSKVQPPLEKMLARVTAHQGGLPPLTRTATSALPAADGAKVSLLSDVVKTQTPEIQAMANRLANALATPAATPARAPASARGRALADDVEAHVAQNSVLAAIKALHNPKVEGTYATAAAPAPASPTSQGAHKGTLIDVLKAMKGR